jgi:hypothetical protein
MKRVLLTCTALACLGLALAASRNSYTVTERIDNAFTDLSKTQAPIPHATLHAKALAILRDRTVAKDDSPENSQLARDLGADDLDRQLNK